MRTYRVLMKASWLALALLTPVLNASAVTPKTGATIDTIFVNGTLATGTMSLSGVTAPSGEQWSELQNDAGNLSEANTSLGAGAATFNSGTFRLADDFTVPDGQVWTVKEAVFHAYQSNYSGATSPIDAYWLRIWNGPPGLPDSTILCGDTSTNRLLSSADAKLLRISNSAYPAPGTSPGTTRRIWASTVTLPPLCAADGYFTPGTYWLEWTSRSSTNVNHFAPTVTVLGQRTRQGSNARQQGLDGTWVDLFDGGNPVTAPDVRMDFPFQLRGSISGALYVNGPLATGARSKNGDAAPAGSRWSELQNDLGNLAETNISLGQAGAITAGTTFRLADDFTVPNSQAWTLSEAVFYSYQTGFAGTSAPIDLYTLKIWDGVPEAPGSTLLCGDGSTNRLLSSSDSYRWRINNSAVPSVVNPTTTRRIWASTVSIPAPCSTEGFFTTGTYWLDWNSRTTTNGTHFSPSVTRIGQRYSETDNARQFSSVNGWQALVDAGNPSSAPDVPIALPFQLLGTRESVIGIFADGFEAP